MNYCWSDTEKDCIYHLGTAKSVSQYTEITQILINHVRKNYSQGKDIGDALETLTEFDATVHKPTLQQSTNADKAFILFILLASFHVLVVLGLVFDLELLVLHCLGSTRATDHERRTWNESSKQL